MANSLEMTYISGTSPMCDLYLCWNHDYLIYSLAKGSAFDSASFYKLTVFKHVHEVFGVFTSIYFISK